MTTNFQPKTSHNFIIKKKNQTEFNNLEMFSEIESKFKCSFSYHLVNEFLAI